VIVNVSSDMDQAAWSCTVVGIFVRSWHWVNVKKRTFVILVRSSIGGNFVQCNSVNLVQFVKDDDDEVDNSNRRSKLSCVMHNVDGSDGKVDVRGGGEYGGAGSRPAVTLGGSTVACKDSQIVIWWWHMHKYDYARRASTWCARDSNCNRNYKQQSRCCSSSIIKVLISGVALRTFMITCYLLRSGLNLGKKREEFGKVEHVDSRLSISGQIVRTLLWSEK
jgi:hypothetical protein